MSTRLARPELLAALIFAGCSDPVGVCERRYACEVAGVDLAVVRAELANPLGTDPVTLLPEAPRELELHYVVRNRGSVRSAAVTVRAAGSSWYPYDFASNDSAAVPQLLPGDSVTGTLRIRIGAPFVLGSAERDAVVYLERATAEGDADAGNDTLHTSPFQLSIPALDLRAEPLRVPRVRANEPFALSYTLRNQSRHESTAGISLFLCLFDDGDMPCFPDWAKTMAARFEPPVVAPGGTLQEERTLAIAPTAAWQDEAWSYGLTLCAVESSWPDPYARPRGLACVNVSAVRVRPDYQSCHPPVLAPGVTQTFTDYNCGFVPSTLQDGHGNLGGANVTTRMLLSRFYLVALDLVAGGRYSLLKAGGGAGFDRIFDAEGERQVSIEGAAGFTVARTGRYYAVTYSGTNSPPQLQLILREP